MRLIRLCFISTVIFTMGFFLAPMQSQGFEISIQVAPSTLNIQSASQVVTVHTSIAYSSVTGASVTLNDIPISWWKADNQGNFVAKFQMDAVKELALSGGLTVPGENTLTLVGLTTDEAMFTGTQTITIINVVPSGSGAK
ncbi:MAG: hypothetical protein JXA41_03005 [Deltaproteobacteria bacterium]|nr:hypothetical protein [Deltaproteobacteria bacterium]